MDQHDLSAAEALEGPMEQAEHLLRQPPDRDMNNSIHPTVHGAHVAVIEAHAQHSESHGELAHGTVEEVLLQVDAEAVGCQCLREPLVGGSVGEAQLDLHLYGWRSSGSVLFLYGRLMRWDLVEESRGRASNRRWWRMEEAAAGLGLGLGLTFGLGGWERRRQALSSSWRSSDLTSILVGLWQNIMAASSLRDSERYLNFSCGPYIFGVFEGESKGQAPMESRGIVRGEARYERMDAFRKLNLL